MLPTTLDEGGACMEELSSMPLAARCRVPGVRKDRGDILPAGLIIVVTLLQMLHAEMFVMNGHGLRDGIVRQMSESLQKKSQEKG